MDITFEHTRVEITPGRVRTHFIEYDIHVDCMVECGHSISPEFPSLYRNYARYWGYGSDWRLYAYHHDLTHSAYSEWFVGQCSPTLLAAARGAKWEYSEHEEFVVNTIQWTLATGDCRPYESYLNCILGTDWLSKLERIGGLLDRVRVPLIEGVS